MSLPPSTSIPLNQKIKKPMSSKKKLIIAAIIVVPIVLCMAVALIQGTTPEAIATATAKAIVTNSFEQTRDAPTLTPEPTLTQEPRAALRTQIEKALGVGNRDLPRLVNIEFDTPDAGEIYIQWSINDNLTEDYIIMGAKVDATEILKALAFSQFDYTSVMLSGYFPLVDAFGNSREANVVTLRFDRYTVGRIDWTGFLSDNIYNIADEKTIHPIFDK